MKNINRYKLVPALVIGLVLSAFNAMAEVKTIVVDRGETKASIEIKEGEVGKIISISGVSDNGTKATDAFVYVTLIGVKVRLNATSSKTVFAGPAVITLEYWATSYAGPKLLSVDVTPNEKH